MAEVDMVARSGLVLLEFCRTIYIRYCTRGRQTTVKKTDDEMTRARNL